jgi:predicted branched-subunit amino acid permease
LPTYPGIFAGWIAMDWGEFWSGVKRGAPVVVSAGPFGILFGALAVDHGLSMPEAVLMSATIYAGASQLVGLDLFSHHLQPWLVILSILAVNFRHVLYSAAIARPVAGFTPVQKAVNFFLLTDPHFAEIERRWGSGIVVTFSWALGLGLTVYLSWVGLTFAGALLGAFIGDPRALGLDVLLSVYFLGLVLGFRSRANWLPVIVASSIGSIVGLKLFGSPWHVSVGALVGILVAMVMPLPKPQPEPDMLLPAEDA